MIWIDYAILILLMMTAFNGTIRGWYAEIFALLVWVVAIMLSFQLSDWLAHQWVPLIEVKSLRLAAASLSICLVTVVLGIIVASAINDYLKVEGFNLFSRLGGAGAGIARGIVIVTFIIFLAGMTPLPTEAWWHDAQLVFPFQKMAVWLKKFAPSALAEHIKFN